MSEAAAATAAPLDTTTVPAISDLLQPQPMTVEQAQARRVEYSVTQSFEIASFPEIRNRCGSGER